MHNRGLLISTALAAILSLSYTVCAQTPYQFKISGVNGAMRDNIDIYLQKYTAGNHTPGVRFQTTLQQEIQTALQALGYYHSDITVTANEATPRIMHIQVQAGEPVRISQSDIHLSGDATVDADFAALLSKQAPKQGQVLHHGAYDGFKSALKSLALRKGYFDADFTLTRLEVAPELKQAFVRLHFNSGKRYKFGAVSFNGNQIAEPGLRSLIPFNHGDFYLTSQLGELNQALATTGWFSSILVEGNTTQIQNFTLPINVELQPERRNIIETGIGYSTDVKTRLKLNWNKPWLNRSGHSLSSKLALSEIEQSVEAAYKVPLASVANDFYQVQLGFRNRDNQDTESRESNLALERHWLLQSDWYRTASVRWLYEDFVQADQNASISLIMPGISFNRSKQSSGSMPSSANRLLLGVEVSDEAWGSDASFVRLRSRIGWIGSAGNNHRLVTRLDGGAVLMEGLSQLPPSLRFFAGGDNSIRGYGYETVSPRNSEDELTGGRYMATAALEYQYRVKGNWWLAAFSDYGSAWDDKPEWVQGVGFGVRWASPVGPVRLDFAWGLDGPDKGFQLHFALGPEL
ncbi:autotransporter assembly complex protein TamA [Rheinheimera maricola]|uniref:Translocation and assembly module subunit TamA n=1 Tax=Rheinheimera maricola TaxID=2793282 RepID=A0ABS7X4X1_9GAMM|nr:autotransporter assembly complex family protein [Rheinheimera maricola]MBZ9610591.1 autotransporter assembly complex protein TamA [Rheinheimera maricola]